jgi:hypothetical protein
MECDHPIHIGGRNLVICIDGTANQFGDKREVGCETLRMLAGLEQKCRLNVLYGRKGPRRRRKQDYDTGYGTWSSLVPELHLAFL